MLLIIPTDTVYGIAANYDDLDSVNQINILKKRSKDQKMQVLCSSLEMVEKLSLLNNKSRELIKKFLPGPLNIILPSSLAYFSHTRESTIGIRIPNNSQTLELINKFGPLKATSVNEHNEEPLNDYQTILDIYGRHCQLCFESKFEFSKVSSTVISLLENNPTLIREGEIKFEDILSFWSLND
jgi:L-threonylcarbamoyladenylate synthase